MIGFTRSGPQADFERQIMPHLNAAFSLARFLMRNDQDAEDVVQDASLRAFRFYESFRGENSRAWFLRIVRNTAFSMLKKKLPDEAGVVFDEELHTPEPNEVSAQSSLDLEMDRQTVRNAIEQLPPEFREVLTLRELEGCSYKEVADIAAIPVGTVMSRLARARRQLYEILSKNYPERTKP